MNEEIVYEKQYVYRRVLFNFVFDFVIALIVLQMVV